MGATEVYTADSRCPFSSNAGPGNGMALTYDTHSASGRKNLFPRRPVIYRRDIEILMSNVIKMLAGYRWASAVRRAKKGRRSSPEFGVRMHLASRRVPAKRLCFGSLPR